MTTVLQIVLLLSVLVGIVGGCGMEVRFILVTILLLKLAGAVLFWWRTFQQERNTPWIRYRLIFGAAAIIILSASQILSTHAQTPLPNLVFEENQQPELRGRQSIASSAQIEVLYATNTAPLLLTAAEFDSP